MIPLALAEVAALAPGRLQQAREADRVTGVSIDSRTVVRPSARSPARRTADFTCALGTGVV